MLLRSANEKHSWLLLVLTLDTSAAVRIWEQMFLELVWILNFWHHQHEHTHRTQPYTLISHAVSLTSSESHLFSVVEHVVEANEPGHGQVHRNRESATFQPEPTPTPTGSLGFGTELCFPVQMTHFNGNPVVLLLLTPNIPEISKKPQAHQCLQSKHSILYSVMILFQKIQFVPDARFAASHLLALYIKSFTVGFTCSPRVCVGLPSTSLQRACCQVNSLKVSWSVSIKRESECKRPIPVYLCLTTSVPGKDSRTLLKLNNEGWNFVLDRLLDR